MAGEEENKNPMDEFMGLKVNPAGHDVNGGVLWLSRVDEQFFVKRTGMSIMQLCRTGRIVDKDGGLCPPPPRGMTDPEAIAQYYNDWFGERLREGKVLFYDDPKSKLPTILRNDKGHLQSLLVKEEPGAPKQPGWFNRRRDRKLREGGGEGTPEMNEYRKKLEAYESAKKLRDRYEKLEVMKERLRDNLKDVSKKQEDTLTEEEKASVIRNMANLTMCESLLDMEKDDPLYVSDVLDEIEEKVDHGTDVIDLCGSHETKFIKGHIGPMNTPADVEKMLEEKPAATLKEEYLLNVKLQKKTLKSPFISFEEEDVTAPEADEAEHELGGENEAAELKKTVRMKVKKPGWKEESNANFEKLNVKAQEALERLKDIGAAGGNIPSFLLPQVKRDLALVSLQSIVNHAVNTDKSELAEQIVNRLGDEEPYQDEKGIFKSDLDRALDHFENGYIEKLNVEDMDGRDIARFLAKGEEENIVKSFIQESAKPVYVLKNDAFGQTAEQHIEASLHLDSVTEAKHEQLVSHDVPSIN